MSADNLVQAFPFRKSTGEVVWRVMEATMSGLPYETCLYMSTRARDRRFAEFSGPQAAAQACAAARRMERKLTICEYGLSLAGRDDAPLSMEDLKQRALDEGYDAYDLEEATDEQLARLPKNWLLQDL